MNRLEIENVIGREIMDSRGNPTMEGDDSCAANTMDVRKFSMRLLRC